MSESSTTRIELIPKFYQKALRDKPSNKPRQSKTKKTDSPPHSKPESLPCRLSLSADALNYSVINLENSRRASGTAISAATVVGRTHRSSRQICV